MTWGIVGFFLGVAVGFVWGCASTFADFRAAPDQRLFPWEKP